ncbi:MAG: diphthine--ammonia ligase [Bacteroidetes bacterium]|nr:MAG: diphthine--ammonia ligase [Bacteroidota bacterium]
MHSGVKAVMSWSGGKDSALALYKMLNDSKYAVKELFTTYNTQYNRVSIHGVRKELMKKQAELIGLPVHFIALEGNSYAEYESKMSDYLNGLAKRGITHVIYGDIFLEDLKNYRDAELKKHGLKGVYPLWKQDTKKIVSQFLKEGFKTYVCAVNLDKLSEDFLGLLLNEGFLERLPENVDFCGENGEFHTFCFDGPLFKSPLSIVKGKKYIVSYFLKEKEVKTGYIDLLLNQCTRN